MMINTVDDDSGEAANMLSKGETGMFFDLVEALLENEGHLSKNDAFDYGRDHRMTMTDAELALSRMERMKWFKTVKTGPEEEATLVFGPRAIGELPHVRNFTRNLSINRPNNVAGGGGGHHHGGGNVNAVMDDDDEAEEDASYPVGNTRGHGGDDDEEEEEVVVARSARKSMLPRMSQDREPMGVDNDEDEEVEDADEDEDVVEEVQQARHSRGSRSSSHRSGSRQSRTTRSRSTRSRSSQYD